MPGGLKEGNTQRGHQDASKVNPQTKVAYPTGKREKGTHTVEKCRKMLRACKQTT